MHMDYDDVWDPDLLLVDRRAADHGVSFQREMLWYSAFDGIQPNFIGDLLFEHIVISLLEFAVGT